MVKKMYKKIDKTKCKYYKKANGIIKDELCFNWILAKKNNIVRCKVNDICCVFVPAED
jgi:hypothetical protein